MIYFARDGTKLVVKIESGIPVSQNMFSFERDEVLEYRAELLRQHLTDELQSRLRELEKEAYAAGWRDAKAKSKKRQFFLGMFSTRNR